ncbi:carbamoyltransferase HypF [[Phormidium] sp. ETS-05]|uniref:carbamoyltransferase HypF n=1 Tax=[Phormidium] sp. ETS-05 TaxID=222819 RepID=UPI0018EEFB9D|nr:carbamoyltransferase HypF [[Phormidium] sp. ETS-05]
MPNKLRCKITIKGAVQGVGFRPFVYRLATELSLPGWVNNSAEGVFIEIEGSQEPIELFLQRLETEKPPLALINTVETAWLEPVGYGEFEIRASVGGAKTAIVLPDISTCSQCLAEIFDPQNRRYLYPFTNCTNCGPRYSIVEALPYDRPHTTMKHFPMCPQCLQEYENPLNRRFHAQPNACPQCGPHLELWNERGEVLSQHHDALLAAAEGIKQGKILAMKGLGGFHLMVDGGNETAVQLLRSRKQRPEKPFALMYPSLAKVKQDCPVSEIEAKLLLSPEAPIVLLRRHSHSNIAPGVAPGNPYIGVMLPYTPLHHLLMAELGFPVVATSGNLSDEPICTDETEAISRLQHIADVFLVHNRPIARAVDDSLVRELLNQPQILRRARGYAPLPISPSFFGLKPNYEPSHPPILAVGAHLKNTIAIAIDNQIFLSQHIGDLATPQAFQAFQTTIASLSGIYDFQPAAVACDAHPDYISTQYATALEVPTVGVQHHYAHVLACMAENQIKPPVLGVAWDGTGYGEDDTIWGGEFILITDNSWQRVAHWRTFRLPGGEKAIKEPRRAALGLLYEIWGEDLFTRKDILPLQAFTPSELEIIKTMLRRNLNTPVTSSAGRLFDAVAAILGIRQTGSFEGQAAMELEFISGPLQMTKDKGQRTNNQLDWEPLVKTMLTELDQGVPVGVIAARFHHTLAEEICTVARQVGTEQVVLTGGCFQNQYLTVRTVERLREEGFSPYWHKLVPPNDGGICLGQIMAALRQ